MSLIGAKAIESIQDRIISIMSLIGAKAIESIQDISPIQMSWIACDVTFDF